MVDSLILHIVLKTVEPQSQTDRVKNQQGSSERQAGIEPWPRAARNEQRESSSRGPRDSRIPGEAEKRGQEASQEAKALKTGRGPASRLCSSPGTTSGTRQGGSGTQGAHGNVRDGLGTRRERVGNAPGTHIKPGTPSPYLRTNEQLNRIDS
jgi:hypothetical protein